MCPQLVESRRDAHSVPIPVSSSVPARVVPQHEQSTNMSPHRECYACGAHDHLLVKS